MTATKKPLTACDVLAIIEKNYGSPAYALLHEVGNSTGYRCNRHADAVAMSLWPSRGIFLRGFEVKVDRQDWLHEVRNPRKSAEVQQYCSYWDVVVSDDSIVQLSEVPETWGLLVAEPKGRKLRTLKAAPKLDAKPLDIGFVASVLRRAAVVQKELMQSEYQRGRADGAKDAPCEADQNLRNEMANLKRKNDHLTIAIDNFEKASGVKIDMWSGSRVGQAFLEYMQLTHQYRSAEGAINQMERGATDLLKQISVWKMTAEKIEKGPEGGSEQ